MSNHCHATTERPADIDDATWFDVFCVSTTDDPFVQESLPASEGVPWGAYPDPVEYDTDDDNPEVQA